MKEQVLLNLTSKQLTIFACDNHIEIAEIIAESSTYSRMQQLIKMLQENSIEKWERVRKQLINMFIVAPERMYTSSHFLSKEKLFLLRDLFRQEINIDQAYFRNEIGVLLLAVTEGFFSQPLNHEQTLKLKQYFVKNIKKQAKFWGLSHLESLSDYICDQSTGYFPSFSTTEHALELDRFEYFFEFYTKNASIFPHSIDIESILFKIMLCLRETNRDKQLLAQIRGRYFQTKYHFQTTLKNMKFALQFFRNTFLQKECLYYPQKIIISLLEQYSQQQVEKLIEGTWLGLKWDQKAIYNCFTACIKLGITNATCKIMIALIALYEKHHKYNELIYNYENNIGRLFIFIKHSKLFALTSKLLKYFIYSPNPQVGLYQKFVQKAIPLGSIIPQDIRYPFLNILQTVAFLYKDTTIVTDLTSTIDSLLGDNVNRLTEDQIKNEINQYSWKANFKSKALSTAFQKQTGYKGLINIGNSCYMNSFLQSLFMNREFRNQVLAVSTLELEKEKLQQLRNDGKDLTTVSKALREDLKPLAELQRLFALLLTSKRTEVTPLPIKNISPPQFRNHHQHDTLQFGRLFLDMLYKNKINRIFEGEITTSIECQACKTIRQRKEAFLDLIVTPQKDQQDLQETIANAFSDEVIHDLICDYCHQRRDNSIKRHYLSKIPNYLIISIKRFQYCVQEKKNHKIMSKINIRPTIVLKDQNYDLYSLIIHRGPSPNAGHYFSFSKHSLQPDSKWICHNDSDVTQLQGFQELMEFMNNNESDTPYILFYERRDHIDQIKEQLMKPVALRKPLEEYVNRDFLQEQKSKEKKVLPLYNPFNFAAFYKKDEDDDEGNNQNQPFYNNYIL